MAGTEWLRTFVCACQAGSISEAARVRHLSQPAATGHIRALEQAAGTALFVRQPGGVVPTEAGRRLYAEVTGPLERLGQILASLDAGGLPLPPAPVRIGASPEVFGGLVVSRLTASGPPVVAQFGDDDQVLAALVAGDLEIAVTATAVARRGIDGQVAAQQRYVLVAPPATAERPASLADLAQVAAGSAWVSYSSDLPRTRRFWRQHLGRPFDARLQLVAPDLRVVLAAVEAGLGASLLPAMVADPAIGRRSVLEWFPVRDLIEPRPLWASARRSVAERPEVAAVLAALAPPG